MRASLLPSHKLCAVQSIRAGLPHRFCASASLLRAALVPCVRATSCFPVWLGAACVLVKVGVCFDNNKTTTLPLGYRDYTCPALVNRSNWVSAAASSDETFSVSTGITANGWAIATTRVDSTGGWSVNLQFKCCRWADVIAGRPIKTSVRYDNVMIVNANYTEVLSPTSATGDDDLVRLNEPYVLTSENSSQIGIWNNPKWQPCGDNTEAPSWTFSFWARVVTYGPASGLVVMAKTWADESKRSHTSWRIMLYQNGNVGLEAEGVQV